MSNILRLRKEIFICSRGWFDMWYILHNFANSLRCPTAAAGEETPMSMKPLTLSVDARTPPHLSVYHFCYSLDGQVSKQEKKGFFLYLENHSDLHKISTAKKESKAALCHHYFTSISRVLPKSPAGVPTTLCSSLFMVLAAQKALIRGNGSLGQQLR